MQELNVMRLKYKSDEVFHKTLPLHLPNAQLDIHLLSIITYLQLT